MDVYCTRPGCQGPVNSWADLDDSVKLKTLSQRCCATCEMPLILAGRYLPVRLLAQGEVGATFLARDRYTPGMQFCLVKQFQLSDRLSPKVAQMRSRLLAREVAVLEQLANEHPQIPRVFAFFPLTVSTNQPLYNGQFFYLVREFISGQTLQQAWERRGKFSEAQVLPILREVLLVLKSLHDRGAVHRNLKLSNIMRRRDGRLCLLDFGTLSQIVSDSVVAQQKTGIDRLGFAPPEQVVGGPVYPATDLYALAVICLILLTGKDPGDLYGIDTNQWNWREYVQVSPLFGDVLDRLLLPIPDMRFADADEVMSALTPREIPLTLPVRPSPRVALSSVSPTPGKPPASRTLAFSMLELLAIAGFTGFEAALLAIALNNLLDSPSLSMGLWGMIVAGLAIAQFRRWLPPILLFVVASISAIVLALFPFLRASLTIELVLVAAIIAGGSLIVVTALSCLIYQLLSRSI